MGPFRCCWNSATMIWHAHSAGSYSSTILTWPLACHYRPDLQPALSTDRRAAAWSGSALQTADGQPAEFETRQLFLILGGDFRFTNQPDGIF